MQPLEPFFHQLRHSVRLSARSTSSSIPLDRHERRELAIMGDIEPGEWGTALGDDKLTEAIIERVVRTPRTRRKADTSVPPRPTARLRLGARPPCGGFSHPLCPGAPGSVSCHGLRPPVGRLFGYARIGNAQGSRADNRKRQRRARRCPSLSLGVSASRRGVGPLHAYALTRTVARRAAASPPSC